jgi:hypothetical protein
MQRNGTHLLLRDVTCRREEYVDVVVCHHVCAFARSSIPARTNLALPRFDEGGHGP